MQNRATLRRPGYAPANSAVGRRGLHTRQRIVDRAGQLFVAHGYHGTSLDAIAKSVGASRASVYQYFQSKEDILVELFRHAEPAVLAHARSLGLLAPNADGIRNLHQWLVEWASLHDKHAVVLLEFPGVGTLEGIPELNTGAVADKYADIITGKLRDAGVTGIDPADACAALLRIAHMVNLYRFRSMFGLRSDTQAAASLAIAMQLLLFPETPAEVLATVADESADERLPEPATAVESLELCPPKMTVSRIRRVILNAASALFAERGYYAVAMEDIAAAAGISRATLYRHFGSKVKILAELTDGAIVAAHRLAGELDRLAERGPNLQALQRWLVKFVIHQRQFGGVSRAWYDGTLAQQLPVDAVTHGVGAFHRAVVAPLRHVQLPAGMDPRVAAAVFVAVLGRLTEHSASQYPENTADDTAALMLAVLRRALRIDTMS
ncbi:TetR family transcriptional regulator [uncultured Mycobacterium sp.]|uniref:TetR family transcriptional regulator n=1 Tax=uncultured Mycobacterium sp. TaxID=171292 RepID=UPI0035C995F1